MTAAAAQRFGAGRLFGERREPGYVRSFALAFAVHAILVAILFIGVRLQSHAPETVSVELWEPPAPQARIQPPPPPPAPAKVEPPPKPEPRIEKPEIVEKPLPKPKPEPKKVEPPKPPPPKPEPKKAEPKKPAPPRRDLDMERRMREQLAQEQAASQERQMRDMLAREQAAAQARGLATWVDKIRLKIRGNIPAQVLDDVKGNPEAIFDVTLLPTGEVLGTPVMRKSSGFKAYDDAVLRAILKSSPLPKPDQPGLFRRQLELHFRPQDR